MPGAGSVIFKARYLPGIVQVQIEGDFAFTTAGLVYLSPIDVPWPVIVDRVVYGVGDTSAGNVRVGIYKEGATADSPEGAALVVESASIAQGTALAIQLLTIAETVLEPGQYFIGIQGDATTGEFYQQYDPDTNLFFYYQLSGGYGAFTDPCPALTAGDRGPRFLLRVSENLPAGHRL